MLSLKNNKYTKQFKNIANRYFREKIIKVDNKIFKLK